MSDLNTAIQPTTPANGAGASCVGLSVTAAAQTIALPTVPGYSNLSAIGNAQQVTVTNTSTTVTAFVSFAPTSALASALAVIPTGTAGAEPVLPGQKRTFTVPQNTAYAGAIGSAAGPSNVYFSIGVGA
jgi:hypothetical protein